MNFKFFQKNSLLILSVILIGYLIYYYNTNNSNNTIIEGYCFPCGSELNFRILDLLGVQCEGINCEK